MCISSIIKDYSALTLGLYEKTNDRINSKFSGLYNKFVKCFQPCGTFGFIKCLQTKNVNVP